MMNLENHNIVSMYFCLDSVNKVPGKRLLEGYRYPKMMNGNAEADIQRAEELKIAANAAFQGLWINLHFLISCLH